MDLTGHIFSFYCLNCFPFSSSIEVFFIRSRCPCALCQHGRSSSGCGLSVYCLAWWNRPAAESWSPAPGLPVRSPLMEEEVHPLQGTNKHSAFDLVHHKACQITYLSACVMNVTWDIDFPFMSFMQILNEWKKPVKKKVFTIYWSGKVVTDKR